MPDTITPRIGQLSGTARPVGRMRDIFGSGTMERAKRELRELYAEVAANNMKALVDSGEITMEQYRKVIKVVAASLHEEFVPVKR